MRLILTATLGLLTLLSFAQTQMKTKWMPYAAINQTLNILEAEQQIWNYNHKFYDQFTAIPVEDFQSYGLNSKELPVPVKFQYLVEFGLYRWINQTGRLHVGVNIYNYNVTAQNLNRLRFSDMIDATRGFVAASGYSTGDAEYVYNNIAFETSYFIEQELKKVQSAHRFGLGLNFNTVLRSQYFLYANPYYDDGQQVTSMVAFYTAKDIGLSDKAFSLYPTFYYEIRAYQLKQVDLWLSASYSDGLVMMPSKKTAKERRPENRRNAYTSLGIKFTFNRNAK